MRQPLICLLLAITIFSCTEDIQGTQAAALASRRLHAMRSNNSSSLLRLSQGGLSGRSSSSSSKEGDSSFSSGKDVNDREDKGTQLMEQLLQSAVTGDTPAQGSGTGNSLFSSGEKSVFMQNSPTGDCAEPTRADVNRSLAESADIVITGVVMAAGKGGIICAPDSGTSLPLAANNLTKDSLAGPNLVVEMSSMANGSTSALNGSITLLVAVDCVHKGALACSRNDSSLSGNSSSAKCVVAVKIPKQAMPGKRDIATLPPCSITPGFRYMMLLSSEAAASCDGVYSIAHSRIVHSIRSHLGVNYCAPYPSWPSQNTSTDGDGLASLLTQLCPGAAPRKAVKCSADVCEQRQCPRDAGITCVIKSCEGRYMVGNSLTPQDSCVPVFLSQTTGLPVDGCDVTVRQLNRQARQSQRRLGTAGGTTKLFNGGVGRLGGV